jgi:hypothetical protein
MTSQPFCRVTIRDATPPSFPVNGITFVTGYLVKIEPDGIGTPFLPEPTETTEQEVPTPEKKDEPEQKTEIRRVIHPDEPDPEVEVGYSDNALEPLVIMYKDKKVRLTESLYILFRYIYDMHRTEGRTEFEFMEISECISGDDAEISSASIIKSVQRIQFFLEKINSPLDVTFKNETIYVMDKFVHRAEDKFVHEV